MKWWWLSFVDESGFLGVAIVQDRSFAGAVLRAHALGINPGGEVRGFPFPEQEEWRAPEAVRNRLLSFEELREHGLEPVKLGTVEARRAGTKGFDE